MALEANSVDPGAVSTILNRLKSQGIFDQFRRDCLADVDTKPAYQNLRQRVENFVSNFLSRSKWTPEMNKNQLRDRLRRQINQSDMLASGVDRIIEQVVEPKMQYVFRPQIEKVVNQYLHSDVVNGVDGGTRNNGTTVIPDYPPVGMGDAQPMTPPEDTPGPKILSPPLKHPPLPPSSVLADDKKMPPPPQPPPPPLPPVTGHLSVNVDDPAILPSPAFEPIGSSPPHPGASFLGQPIIESPMPEALSDGSPEQMDISNSPEAEPANNNVETEPTVPLLAKVVLEKEVVESPPIEVASPLPERMSPVPDKMSVVPKEVKGILKMPKVMEKAPSSPKTKTAETQKVLSAASSPGSVKSMPGIPQNLKDKLGNSPSLPSSVPSTPEKTPKSEYERKMEIQKKVENLIKQNIKIRDSSDSSDGDSSPEARFGSSDRRRHALPSPERHRKNYWGHERKKARMKPDPEPRVRPEDALRAISPEVVSDEELEKKSVKEVSEGERSEGEVVSSEEDGKKEVVDLGNLSDITVSSVHTSDLSSFSDVSSSPSGSDGEDDKKTKGSSGATTNLKSISKPQKEKPKGISPHPDSSEDEATREERREKAAQAKEERVKKKQLEKEEKSKTEENTAEDITTDKRKIDDDLSPVSTDTDSNKEDAGESPEVKETPATTKPVAKRRISEEEKPPVEVFPSYSSSLSQKKRRLATVKDSFLLTQHVPGKNLLKRKKKKTNNRSGSKLFFRMSGQSGGNTPKRSASPRMGKPTMPRPEGHLVSAAVAKLKSVDGQDLMSGGVPAKMDDVIIFGKVESQDIGTVRQGQFIPLEADRGTLSADVGGSLHSKKETLEPSVRDSNSRTNNERLTPMKEESQLTVDKQQVTSDGAGSTPVRDEKSRELAGSIYETSPEPDESNNYRLEATEKQTNSEVGIHVDVPETVKEEIQRDDAVEEVVVTSEEMPQDDSSNGPATPLMDEASGEEMDVEEPGELEDEDYYHKGSDESGEESYKGSEEESDESSETEMAKQNLQNKAIKMADVEEVSDEAEDMDSLKMPALKTDDVSDAEDEKNVNEIAIEGEFVPQKGSIGAEDVDALKMPALKTDDVSDSEEDSGNERKFHEKASEEDGHPKESTGRGDEVLDDEGKALEDTMTGVEEVSDEEVEDVDSGVPAFGRAVSNNSQAVKTSKEVANRIVVEKNGDESGILLVKEDSQESTGLLEDVEDVSDGEEEVEERVITDQSVVLLGSAAEGIRDPKVDTTKEREQDSNAKSASIGKADDRKDVSETEPDIPGVAETKEGPVGKSSDKTLANIHMGENVDRSPEQETKGDGDTIKADAKDARSVREAEDHTEVQSLTSEALTLKITEQQTCKVVLQHMQLTPELKAGRPSTVWDSSPEDSEVGRDIPVVQGSWVEEIEEGVVQVHDLIDASAEKYDSPPTPTQDEPVTDEGVVIIEEGGYVKEVVSGDTASIQAGDMQERIGEASAEKDDENESIHIKDEVFTQEAISGTDTGVTAGRRSRRTVSDRHSKDEDFVYFGMKRKTRPRSQSPTPSLQSNESESSHTSSRSSTRSSRRNSGRSGTDQEEKRPEQSRKRHASQELPSTSLAEERPRRARRGSPPSRYSPSESVTQRVTKRKHSPPPQPPSQAPPQPQAARRIPKREHNTRHSTSSNRDSDFVYDLPKRRADRQSVEERPSKRKR